MFAGFTLDLFSYDILTCLKHELNKTPENKQSSDGKLWFKFFQMHKNGKWMEDVLNDCFTFHEVCEMLMGPALDLDGFEILMNIEECVKKMPKNEIRNENEQWLKFFELTNHY